MANLATNIIRLSIFLHSDSFSDRAIYDKSLPSKSLNDIGLLDIGDTCPDSYGNDLEENKFIVSGCMQIPQQLDFPQGGKHKASVFQPFFFYGTLFVQKCFTSYLDIT